MSAEQDPLSLVLGLGSFISRTDTRLPKGVLRNSKCRQSSQEYDVVFVFAQAT